jgi:hypothetical protein
MDFQGEAQAGGQKRKGIWGKEFSAHLLTAPKRLPSNIQFGSRVEI